MASRSPLGARVELPGPVGERNVYVLRRRGLIAACAETATGLRLQLAAILATGNDAAVPAMLAAAALQGLPAELKARVTGFDDPLAAPALAGALIEGEGETVARGRPPPRLALRPDPARRRAFARRTRRRRGLPAEPPGRGALHLHQHRRRRRQRQPDDDRVAANALDTTKPCSRSATGDATRGEKGRSVLCGRPRRNQLTKKPGAPRPSITDQEALLFHSRGRPGKLEVVATKPMATQRDLVARLFPRRRRAGEGDRRRSLDGLRLHQPRQHGRRHHQRHRDPRPRQSRRARLQAGDGRQGGAVQALRRRRFHRPRSRHRGPGRIHQRRQVSRAPRSAASTSRTSRRRSASSSRSACAS